MTLESPSAKHHLIRLWDICPMDVPTLKSELETMSSLTSHPLHIMQLLLISILPNVLHGLFNLIIIKTSWIKNYYYPSCTNEETETQEG